MIRTLAVSYLSVGLFLTGVGALSMRREHPLTQRIRASLSGLGPCGLAFVVSFVVLSTMIMWPRFLWSAIKDAR